MGSDIPCRVSADLRRHMSAESKAALDYANNLPARRQDALDALEDPELLRAVLDDEQFASPLARAFRNLDRAFAGDIPSRDAVLQSVLQIQRTCFSWLLEKSE